MSRRRAGRPGGRSPVRATVAGVVTVALAGVLAGCGSAEDDRTALPEPTQVRWNPCEGLEVDAVADALGIELTMDEGTPAAPVCGLVPAVDGDPAFDANYLLFPEGLDAAWSTMGDFADDDVLLPDIAGTDDARLVVDTDDDTLYLTGFVQNGDLIQTVNVIDPAPFDRASLVRATRLVMTDLSEHAVDSGLTSHG